MNDSQIMRTIGTLVDEEHELVTMRQGGDLSEEQHARLREVEVSLDQCWDLLRQRRARREFGQNPDEATVRPAAVVERYQQ